MSDQEWTKSEPSDPCEPRVSQMWAKNESRVSQEWAKGELRTSQGTAKIEQLNQVSQMSREWAKWANLRHRNILLFAVCFSLLIWQT